MRISSPWIAIATTTLAPAFGSLAPRQAASGLARTHYANIAAARPVGDASG